MRDFRKLRVWRSAFDLTVEVYRISRSWPREERFGLTAQVRESANSIGANIAESCGSEWPKDQARFLQHAMRSECETHHHLLVAHAVEHLTDEQLADLEAKLAIVRRQLLNYLDAVLGRERPSGPRGRSAAAKPPSRGAASAAPSSAKPPAAP